MPDTTEPTRASPEKPAMPTGGDPEGDAAGALRGGEAQRGQPDTAPRPLGRKDPTVGKGSAPNKENVPIRD